VGNKSVLPAPVTRALRSRAPSVAKYAGEAIATEIQSYALGVRGPNAEEMLESAILVALNGLLRVTELPASSVTAPVGPQTLEAAYDFGRYEAQSGRSPDALLAAYRVGARVAWRDFSEEMIACKVAADVIAVVAELVFAYIDQLSAASLAGHADEIASVGRAHEHHLDRLIRGLLEYAPRDALDDLAATAGWPPPRTLTAVILPVAQARPALQFVDHRTLLATSDLAPDAPDHMAVLLVPDVDRTRVAVVEALNRYRCVVGPTRAWFAVAESYQLAMRARELTSLTSAGSVDTDAHLAALIIESDAASLTDLRDRVLAPLRGLRPATAARLAETLRSWLLHQGRREEVAAALNVHPQTVRYRIGQLREMFGDALTTPDKVLDLIVALATLQAEPETEATDEADA
jgi:hypothetical protein